MKKFVDRYHRKELLTLDPIPIIGQNHKINDME